MSTWRRSMSSTRKTSSSVNGATCSPRLWRLRGAAQCAPVEAAAAAAAVTCRLWIGPVWIWVC